jgi:hypothetical protein
MSYKCDTNVSMVLLYAAALIKIKKRERERERERERRESSIFWHSLLFLLLHSH